MPMKEPIILLAIIANRLKEVYPENKAEQKNRPVDIASAGFLIASLLTLNDKVTRFATVGYLFSVY